jgi:hypothetical protein
VFVVKQILVLHFNINSSVSHAKRNLDKCVYPVYLKAIARPETAEDVEV